MKRTFLGCFAGFALGLGLTYPITLIAQNVNNNLSQALAAQYHYCWDQPALDLSEANSFIYKVVDNNVVPEVTIAATCVGDVSPFTCTSTNNLSGSSNGNHLFSISTNIVLADNSTLQISSTSPGNYRIVGPPDKSINLRIKK